MPQAILYIAQSLDGFIAKPDGNLDWLTSTPPSELGDYGYTELFNSIETIIMGRKPMILLWDLKKNGRIQKRKLL
jgi:dihydrofolate reductase